MIKVVTHNTEYKNGKDVKNWSEFHEINGGYNLDYIFENIDSIIENNINHGNSALISITVLVSYTMRGILDKIINHYKDKSIKVESGGMYLIG